jgi:hypothetical protein
VTKLVIFVLIWDRVMGSDETLRGGRDGKKVQRCRGAEVDEGQAWNLLEVPSCDFIQVVEVSFPLALQRDFLFLPVVMHDLREEGTIRGWGYSAYRG